MNALTVIIANALTGPAHEQLVILDTIAKPTFADALVDTTNKLGELRTDLNNFVLGRLNNEQAKG